MAGEKALTEGGGNDGQPQKGAKLSKAVAELKAAEKLFPLAATMAEGLRGAKEAAVEEMTASMNSIRGRATGLEQIGKDVREKAAKVEEHAAAVRKAEEGLLETGRSLDEKATASASSAAAAAASAEEVNTAITSLRIKVGENEFSGVKALEVLGRLVTGIPNSVKKEVERVVSAEVEGETKKGADLISHVVLKADAAEAASGNAVEKAEHAEELIELAGEQVRECQGRVTAAEEAANKAEEKAGEAAESAGLVESLRAELKETKKALDMAVGVIMTILNNNGLNTEVSDDEMREIEAEASSDDAEASSAGEPA